MVTPAQQFLFRMAITAGYEPTRRARENMRPIGPFWIGHPVLSARAALQFAIYEMEGRWLTPYGNKR